MDPVEQLIGRRLVLLEGGEFRALTEVTRDGEVVALSFLGASVPAATDLRIFIGEELSERDRDEVARIARGELKGDKIDERVLRGVKNALTSLFATFYTRRAFWRNELSINPQS